MPALFTSFRVNSSNIRLALRRVYPSGTEGKGFTLVELLVVVAIIGVLSTIGITVFTGARQSANDAKVKADIDAIKKAYDASYDPITNTYRQLQPSDFSGGKIPTRPNGTAYTSVVGAGSSDPSLPAGQMSSSGEAFKVCTPLSGNSSSTCFANSPNCYCTTSSQGNPAIITSVNALIHPASCDPNGTLSNGLVGYWKMDESAWAEATGEVKDLTLNTLHGRAMGGANTTPRTGNFVRAGLFNANGKYVEVPHNAKLNITNEFSISLWINPSNLSVNHNFINRTGSWQMLFWASGSQLDLRTPGGSIDSNNDHHFATGGVALNGWTHLVLTYKASAAGNNMKLYKNGVTTPVSSARYTGSLYASSNPLQIGSWPSGEPFIGQVDDVRIYNRELTPTEVAAINNTNNGCIP